MAAASEVRVVVGIDFGTTFSGFAYAHKDKPDEIIPVYEWPGQEGKPYCKTQTGLFYLKKTMASNSKFSKPEYELTDWGWPAQARRLREGRAAGSGFYLTKFKLHLAPRQTPDLSSQVKGLDISGSSKRAMAEAEPGTGKGAHAPGPPKLPEGLSVVTATADYLNKISALALEKVQETYGSHITARDVQWCLTVPAIWDDSAKQIMRKCAEMAGLVTGPSCPPQLAKTASPHPVRIVLESEAASAYCAKTRAKQVKLKPGDEFMVADIGGGTTDIVVNVMISESGQELKLRETQASSGGLYGGTNVDANFLQFMRAVIDGFAEVESQNPTALTALNKSWLEMKHSFDGSRTWGPYRLPIPGAVIKTWKLYDTKGSADREYDQMVFTTAELKEIFDPVVDRIIELIQKAITPGLKLLLLVGGFSESPYLRARVKAALAGRLGDKIVMPPQPGSAVCQGAVLFGFAPNLVVSRVARKTYGVEKLDAFDAERDPKEFRTWNSRGWRCRHRFNVFVQKGQSIGVDECFSVPGVPSSADQAVLGLRIFSTDATEVRYTTDPGVVLEGEFEMDISHDPEKRGLDRSVRTSMFFGESFIRVMAQRENFGDTQEKVDMAAKLEL